MPDQNDRDFRLDDIPAAIGLLSRLPVRVNPEFAAERGARAGWAYPLAGALIGAVVGILSVLALAFGLGAGPTAALALGAMAMITGALHEDGLADTADGFWGGHEAPRRLEIMKDSRIGTYGVLALILTTLVRWSALSTLFSAGAVLWPLIGVAALSRVPMVAMMQTMDNPRAGGLSAAQGRPGDTAVLGALGLAAILGVISFGASVFLIAIALALVSFIVARVALAKIGGQTGDVLGATQQIAEVVILTIAAALI